MPDIVGFTAELRRTRNRELPEIVRTWQRRVGLAALSSVVLKTPVDTGRARANWQAGTTTNESPLDVLDPTGSSAIQTGQARLQAVAAYDDIFIFNNVEYIRFLEEGSSQQAPQGMAAITVRELEGRLEQLARDLRFRAR